MAPERSEAADQEGLEITRRAREQLEGRRRPASRSASWWGSTGVSGAGKSTLVNGILYPALARTLNRARGHPGDHDAVLGHRESRQGDRHRSVAHRPDAAVEPGDLHQGVRRDPGLLREPPRGARPRLRGRAVLLQRQGRTVRALRGRRRHQGGDALPRRRLRALRGMPGPPLQRRDARDPVQGHLHRRRARPHRFRSGRAVPESSRGSGASSRRSSKSGSVTSGSARARRRSPEAKRRG